MRVLLVTTIERGGPVEHARLLARELVAAGAEVRAVTGSVAGAEAFAAAGADAVVVASRSPFAATGPARVHRLGRDVDVVHSHDRRGGLWTLGPPRPRRGPARVHTLHGLPDAYLPLPDRPARPSRRDDLAYRVVEARLVGRADALLLPSRASLALASRLGYRTARAVVVPNGVDTGRGDGEGGGAGAAGARPLGPDVGVLAVLEPVKGVDVFLAAAARLHADDPTLRFAIFGDGSQRPALEECSARAGLAGVVRFAGHVPAEVALAQLRVLVVSSHFESGPLAMLEGMAAGVPVVATRVGGIPEAAPEEALVLVPPNDPAALADAIGATVRDPGAAAARAARARAHVVAQRSAAGMATATEAVYRGALDRRGR